MGEKINPIDDTERKLRFWRETGEMVAKLMDREPLNDAHIRNADIIQDLIQQK